jgi:hypothetical protein
MDQKTEKSLAIYLPLRTLESSPHSLFVNVQRAFKIFEKEGFLPEDVVGQINLNVGEQRYKMTFTGRKQS